jgi:uncharacterized protein (TIGR02453 family)
MAFTIDTFKFLDELTLNNERTWFDANKDRYESLVREPALAFIRAMAGPLAKVAPAFAAVDKKVGGSLMRVYRDTRFATDKTPYKTNIGIHFRHGAGKDVHAPGFYVHVSPTDNFVALGMWRPEPPILAAVRTKMAADPARWTKLVGAKALAKVGLELGLGDKLSRVPKGFDKDHPLADELKRTSFVLSAPLTAKDITTKGFVAYVAARFSAGQDFMRYLCEAAGAPY